MISKNYSATDLIKICDRLEGEYIGGWNYTYNDPVNGLKSRLRNFIGIDFALHGEDFRNRLYKDIKDMMFIDSEGKLQYKDF